ncbi:universal stress protein [Ornithinimicrobium pekingense]|uniref:Universal stress protein n=1 Tax=Ornithinimicrobium pekingense TaxID=384677 RepID=A0ABQ2FAU1_9MICO|nr:universal stress protein [Ornithinimicrobium pekingense]GGK78602.1 universal stress protein [Ornithinimicrobium pekingense]
MSYSTVLVPVAPGHGDEARRAVEVARTLVDEGGSITVVTVIEDLPRYLTVETFAVDPQIMESQRAVGEAVVAEFTAPDVEVVVRHGYPTRAILDEIEDGGYDCVVIASAQPGWAHFFLGSTASSVVRHAHCSVHVVRTPAAEEGASG